MAAGAPALSFYYDFICGKTLLDVGCGEGYLGNLIKKYFQDLGLFKDLQVDGIDASPSHVDRCMKSNCYQDVRRQVMPSSVSGVWDTVMAFGIAQYIPENYTERFVEILESATSKRIALVIPNGSYYQGDGRIIDGFNSSSPLTFISQEFFLNRGYRVLGMSGEKNNCTLQDNLSPVRTSFYLAYKNMMC